MEEQIKQWLFNPAVGKIASIFIGIAFIWIIVKVVQKNLFSKIKDNDNRYCAKKFGSFIGYFLTIRCASFCKTRNSQKLTCDIEMFFLNLYPIEYN